MLINYKALKLLLELKKYSKDTFKHSLRVAKLCGDFGKKLGLNDNENKILIIAGLFHDIGKLKIPKDILNKKDKLTKEEYSIIKKHPLYSVELLSNIGFLNGEVLNLILHHHERIDGLGYPYGLYNEDIPKLSKIISICDSYDAMNYKRVYQNKKSSEGIKNEYLLNLGKQFDITYTNLFLNYLEKQDIQTHQLLLKKSRILNYS